MNVVNYRNIMMINRAALYPNPANKVLEFKKKKTLFIVIKKSLDAKQTSVNSIKQLN